MPFLRVRLFWSKFWNYTYRNSLKDIKDMKKYFYIIKLIIKPTFPPAPIIKWIVML